MLVANEELGLFGILQFDLAFHRGGAVTPSYFVTSLQIDVSRRALGLGFGFELQRYLELN